MKKIIIVFTIVFSSIVAFSQTNSQKHEGVNNEDTQDLLLEMPIYKLFPTKNMWTFIKLDTRNGRMWQVQFSVKGDDYRYEASLN
jgi:hypothetical protein